MMDWEAFATPPAPISDAFRRLSQHLYRTNDRRAHDAEGLLLSLVDIKYFNAVGSRHNPLDRRLPA